MAETETDEFVKEMGFNTSETPASSDFGTQGGPGGDLDPKSIFGDAFDSWEKVKTEIPEKLKRFSELEQEVESFKTRNFNYLDPEIGEFDKFANLTGKKDFGTFQKFKESNLEGIDALVFKTVLENPELKGKEDILKGRFLQQYKQDSSMYDETEIALNKPAFNTEVQKAFDYLNEIREKTKLETVSTDPELLKQQKAERQRVVREALDETLKQVSKVSIPMFDENLKKEVPLFDFEIKDDVRSKFLEPLTEAFGSYNINDQTKGLMQSEYLTRVIVDRLPSIMSSAYKAIEAKLRAEIEAEYGGGVTRPKPPGGGGESKSDFEAYLDS